MRRKRISPQSHLGINSLTNDLRCIFSVLSDHRAAQRLALHSFRSFAFTYVRVAKPYCRSRHPQQIRKIEMTCYLDDISEPDLKVKTEQA